MAKALPREWYGEGLRQFGVRREKLRIDARTLLAYGCATALLLVSLLLYVRQGLDLIRTGYELNGLQERYRHLRAERERLEVELASLRNLQVVQHTAVTRLGMVFPEPGQVIVVRGGAPGAPVAAAGSTRAVAAAR